MTDALLLSLLWVVPFAGSLAVLAIPRRFDQAIKAVSLVATLITLALTILAYQWYVSPRPEFNQQAPSTLSLAARAEANRIPEATGHQAPMAAESADVERDLVTRTHWIPYFNIQYYLGLDGISLSLVILTALVAVLACLASWGIEKQVKGYFSLFLLLTASMMGVFLALDMFLFYVFFEVMLLPMYFLIGVWGGDNREYAAIKFLLYTLFGSVFILVAILILYFWAGLEGSAPLVNGRPFTGHSFDAVLLAQVASETSYYSRFIQSVVFILFFIGFAIKLPSFPFHTWLPDAHVEAPTPISMILAGVLLKIGGYGLIRLAWPLAPVGAADWSSFVASLGVFSILYGALAAMAQVDFKKLVAYSSVSHMGYVTLGMAAMALSNDPRYYAYGVNGAMYMMLAHGITSTGMFFLVGVIYERAHTRQLNKLGGLMNIMPVYGAIAFLIFFGSMGLPGLCGFIAEVFVVLAAYNYSILLAVLAAAAVVLTAGYILWTLQRVFLGRNEQYRGLPDMNVRELVVAAPLVILTVLMGIFPQWILGWMGPSVNDMVRAVAQANAKAGTPASVAQAPPVVKVK
jgi:NADH-quinone oxidoreductase subunit M